MESIEAAESYELSPKERRGLFFEIAAVMGAFWFPAIAQGALHFYQGASRPASDIASRYVLPMLTYLAWVGVIVYVAWRSHEHGLSGFGFVVPTWRDVPRALLLLFAMLAVGIALTFLFYPLRGLPGARILSHRTAASLWFILLYYLVAALFEESLLRAYFVTRLRDLFSGWAPAILVSATVFALPHVYQGWMVLPIVFCHGLMLATAFLRFRTVWPTVLSHAAYNVFVYEIGYSAVIRALRKH